MERSLRILAIALFGLATAAAVGAWSSAAAEPEAAKPSLVVRVRARNGAPIAGASVRAGGILSEGNPQVVERQATTGADGVARVEGLFELAWVRADADGFAGGGRTIIGPSNPDVRDAEVMLVPGAPFDGVVVDAASARPVVGAWVIVEKRETGYRDWRDWAYAVVKTDADGKFHVRGVPEGRVAVARTTAPGYDGDEVIVQSVGGRVTPNSVTIRLRAGGRLVGAVTDPTGRRVVGAPVYVLPARAAADLVANVERGGALPRWNVDFQPAYRTETSDDGSFVVDGLPLGEEYVAVAGDARRGTEPYAPSETVRAIRIDAAHTEVHRDLALRLPSTLVVRLLDAEGEPVTDGTVYAAREPLDRIEPSLFRKTGFTPGEVAIRVEGGSFVAGWLTARLEPGGTTHVPVRVEDGVEVEGVVVDEQGRVVPNAFVEFAPLEGGKRSDRGGNPVHADEEGRFVARHLAACEHEFDADFCPPADERPYFKTVAPVRVRAPATGVRLVVVRHGTASLRVLTPDGKPYRGCADVLAGEAPGPVQRGPYREKYAKDGWFLWRYLKDGDTVVSVEVEDFAPIERRFTARLREHVNLGEATLDPGVELRGRVVDPTAAPIEGAWVRDRNGDRSTAADGTFRLAHLPAGRVRVAIRATDFVDLERNVDVRPGTEPVVLSMARGALVRVAVRGSDAWRPLAGALRADPLPAGRPAPYALGDSDALARTVWRLTPGRWRISRVVAGGDPVPLGEWEFAEGEVRDLEVTRPSR